MSKFCISDGGKHADYVLYLHDHIAPLLYECGANAVLRRDDDRAIFLVTCGAEYDAAVGEEISGLVAEIIAVGYKYDFFDQKIRPHGLTDGQRELLLSALIAADFEEDKRYVKRHCKNKKQIAVDGIYHFLLTPLKKKWEEIVGYIPSVFVSGELADFIAFLLGEKPKKTCYADANAVYDHTCRPLRRTMLLGGGEQLKIVRELLLSGATEVDLMEDIPCEDEQYVRAFYGEHVTFSGLKKKAMQKIGEKG